MKKAIFLAFIFCLFSMSEAFAQQEKGDTEFQIAGTYFTTVGQDVTFSSGFIQAKLGVFITDNIEIGISPNISITTVSSTDFFGETTSNTDVTTGGGAFFQYAFLAGDSRTVPYIGGQYFKSDFENSDDKGSAGVNGGLKFFVSEKAALDFSGNYLFDLNENSQGGLLLFAAGISFLF